MITMRGLIMALLMAPCIMAGQVISNAKVTATKRWWEANEPKLDISMTVSLPTNQAVIGFQWVKSYMLNNLVEREVVLVGETKPNVSVPIEFVDGKEPSQVDYTDIVYSVRVEFTDGARTWATTREAARTKAIRR